MQRTASKWAFARFFATADRKRLNVIMYTQQQFIDKILPYRMQSASILNLALRYVIDWDTPKSLEIKFDGKTCIEGLSTAFTNAAIESGIMHCRALLEFLGLKADKSDHTKLASRAAKRKDDLVIEDFTGPNGQQLARITIDEALVPYKGARDEAENALARAIHIANKGIAHPTLGPVDDAEDLRLLELASRGVPTLVINYFYTRMGLQAPDFQLKSRNRNDVYHSLRRTRQTAPRR